MILSPSALSVVHLAVCHVLAPAGGLPDVPQLPDIPGLPSVPEDSVQSAGGADIDFDDLSRRFEELKKRK